MSNQRVFITGASEGIGRVFAKRMARDGYVVTAVARNEVRLQELMQELGGGDHRYIVADLAREDDVQRVVLDIEQTKYSLLINNAGVGLYGRFFEAPIEKQLHMMRINMDAAVRIAHGFLKSAVSGDALINLSSGLALLPLPASAVYSATKSFILTLSECLWYEQKKRGVYVMGLLPGPTDTEFVARSGAEHHRPPAALVQTAEEVVDTALVGLRARKQPTVICGKANKAFVFLARFRKRKAIVAQMGNMFPDEKPNAP